MLVALILLACTAPPIGSSEPTDPAPRPAETASTGDTAAALPDLLEATWTPSAQTPTWITIAWPPAPGRLIVSWTDDAGAHEVEVDANPGEVVLRALPAGSEVSWTARLVEPDSERVVAMTELLVDTVPAAPDVLVDWTVTPIAPAEMQGLWFLTSQFSFQPNTRAFAVLRDSQGRIRWWREAAEDDRMLRVRLSEDGASILMASNAARKVEERGLIVRQPLDDSPPIVTMAPRLHHDFVEHDGGYAYLAYVDRDVVIDPLQPPLPFTSDAIRLVEEGATGVFDDRWNFFDGWPDPVSQPCSHSVLDAFVPGRIEWTHSNSLVRAVDGDGWWIMARYIDQVARVHDDGTLGAIVGGTTATYAHTSEGLPFAHAHFSQVTDDGHLLIFSNGDHVHRETGSKVVELAVDDGAQTVTTVWSTPEPFERFVGFLGDARRLPGGHTLIGNPNWGIYEVTPDGELLWQAEYDGSVETGRVEAIAPLETVFTRR